MFNKIWNRIDQSSIFTTWRFYQQISATDARKNFYAGQQTAVSDVNSHNYDDLRNFWKTPDEWQMIQHNLNYTSKSGLSSAYLINAINKEIICHAKIDTKTYFVEPALNCKEQLAIDVANHFVKLNYQVLLAAPQKVSGTGAVYNISW